MYKGAICEQNDNDLKPQMSSGNGIPLKKDI